MPATPARLLDRIVAEVWARYRSPVEPRSLIQAGVVASAVITAHDPDWWQELRTELVPFLVSHSAPPHRCWVDTMLADMPPPEQETPAARSPNSVPEGEAVCILRDWVASYLEAMAAMDRGDVAETHAIARRVANETFPRARELAGL